MKMWQVQEAKAHLSEVMEKARREGPQTITRHGRPESVLISVDAYEQMKQTKMPEPNLIDFLLNSGPKFDDFEVERDKDTGREVDLE